MATWNKVKFFYDNIFAIVGGTLTATSTASGYDVANIHNGLEVNSWKATGTTGQRIKVDTFSASTAADSLVIGPGHNLAEIGAVVSLQLSDTGAWAGEQTIVVSNFTPADSGVVLKEFTQTQERYWSLFIFSGVSAPAEIPLLMLCNKTELDYAIANFDPHASNEVAEVNRASGGIVTGIYTYHTERSMRLDFSDVSTPDGWDSDPDNLYYKINVWYENNGMKQFFVAWENANRPDDVFLMHWDGVRNNPMRDGGAYRDITINLKGRKV